MQMVKKIIGSSFIFLFFLLILAPKEEIYYKIEQELEKNGIVISGENFNDNLYGFSITNAYIYFKDIKIAKVKSLDFKILFLYNRLFIEEITTDRAIGEMAGNMIPKEINSIDATFSIMKPYKIAIDANGSFGEIVGGIYLNMNKIFLRIIKPKDINSFKNFLKRDTKGLYYEKFFNQ